MRTLPYTITSLAALHHTRLNISTFSCSTNRVLVDSFGRKVFKFCLDSWCHYAPYQASDWYLCEHNWPSAWTGALDIMIDIPTINLQQPVADRLRSLDRERTVRGRALIVHCIHRLLLSPTTRMNRFFNRRRKKSLNPLDSLFFR